MEMIIVVAIIAILAVITIPTLTAKTDSAEKAADAANLRSAKAAYQVLKMESADNKGPAAGTIFDPTTGTFKTGEKAKTAEATDKCGQCKDHKNDYIVATENGVEWSDATYKTACPGEDAE